MDGNDLIFWEEQRFSLRIRLLVCSLVIVGACIGFFAGQKAISEQGSAESSVLITLFISFIIVPAAILVFFWLFRLQTKVCPDGLYVRVFPFHICYRKFTTDQLEQYYVRDYRPVAEYGGWGIRYSFRGKGKAYNIKGNKGLQLVFKNGKNCL